MKKPAPCPHGWDYTAQHCTQCELDELRALEAEHQQCIQADCLVAELKVQLEQMRQHVRDERATSLAWCQFAMQQHDARVKAERMADLKVNAYRAEYEKAIDDGRLTYGESAKRWVSELRAIKLQVHALVDRFIGNPSQGSRKVLPPDLHRLLLLVDCVWLPNDTVDTVIDMDADAVALPADRTQPKEES